MRMYYRVMVIDPSGKIVRKSRLRRSHSFVFNFLGTLRVQMKPSVNFTLTDIGGTPRSCTDLDYSLRASGGAGNANIGIVVGVGTDAVTNTDTKLQTLIAHGVAGGQLEYGAQECSTPAIIGANVDYFLTRRFSNRSGGTITVNEIGIYWNLIGATTYFCGVRDKLATGFDVADGNAYVVQYLVRTTV